MYFVFHLTVKCFKYIQVQEQLWFLQAADQENKYKSIIINLSFIL